MKFNRKSRSGMHRTTSTAALFFQKAFKVNLFVLLCIGLVTTQTGCEEHHAQKEKVTLLVTSPLRMDTMTTKEYVCQIKSIRHIDLRALEKGYLEEYFVDEGKFVTKGTLMFQILPLMYRAEVEKAQAEMNFAQVEYLNTKALADSNVVSRNELLMAKAKLDKAKAELSLAQVHLGFTQIRAPFDGIMDRLNVRRGSLLNEGDLLSTISDISQMWVYFYVHEAEYLNYTTKYQGKEKLKVKLKMANNEMFKYSGVIETIEADFNNETGNIAFRATFPNPDKLLRHGETGTVIIDVPLKNALIIPQKATFEVLNARYVYVVDKDNVVKAREIKVGAEIRNLYVIESGINENDKILLEGLRLVGENDKISYTFKDPKEVITHLNIIAQ